MSRSRLFSRALASRALLVAVVATALAVPAVSQAVSLTLPKGITQSAAQRMYAEQLDSQATIQRLVDGKFTSFTVVGRKVSGSSATLQLRVVDKTGISRRGVMKLMKADEKWYLSSISRVGNKTSAVSSTRGMDIGVLNTMLAEQAEYSDSAAKLIDGTYNRITVGAPKPGYRSVVIPVVFNGPSGKPVNGEVTAIKKSAGGSDSWFVVSFDAS